MNVVIRGMVLGGQTHHNVGIRTAHRRRIAVGEIDAAVGQADVVDDVLDFARGNLTSNRVLNPIAKIGRFFNAHSGGSTHMKLETAGVNAGKEIAAQPRDQNYQGAEAARKKRNQENAPMMETSFQHSAIALTKSFEGLLETLLQSYHGIAGGGIALLFFICPQ